MGVAARRITLIALALLGAAAPGRVANAKDDGVVVTVERLDQGRRTPGIGVVVTARAPDAKDHVHTYFEGAALPDGQIRVPLRDGPIDVEVSEKGYVSATARVVIDDKGIVAPITLTLRRLATLVVRARDAAGAPRVGMPVRLKAERPYTEESGVWVRDEPYSSNVEGVSQTTDEKGIAVFEDCLPDVESEVRDTTRKSEDPLGLLASVTLEPGERREIDLDPILIGVLRFRLKGPKAGQVVDAAEVFVAQVRHGADAGWLGRATSDREGRVEFPEVPAGRRTTLWASGMNGRVTGDEIYMFARDGLVVAPGKTLDLGDITCGADASLTVVVTANDDVLFPADAKVGQMESPDLGFYVQHVRRRLVEPWTPYDWMGGVTSYPPPGKKIRVFGLPEGSWWIGGSGQSIAGGRWIAARSTELRLPRTEEPIDVHYAVTPRPAKPEGDRRKSIVLKGRTSGAPLFVQWILGDRTVYVDDHRFDVGTMDESDGPTRPGAYRFLAMAGPWFGTASATVDDGKIPEVALVIDQPAARLGGVAKWSSGGTIEPSTQGGWLLAADWKREELRSRYSWHAFSVEKDGRIDAPLPAGFALALVIDQPHGRRGVAILPAMEPGAVRKEDVVFVEP